MQKKRPRAIATLLLLMVAGLAAAQKPMQLESLSLPDGFEIPLTGPRCGGLSFAGTFEALISCLGIGFQYALRSEAPHMHESTHGLRRAPLHLVELA